MRSCSTTRMMKSGRVDAIWAAFLGSVLVGVLLAGPGRAAHEYDTPSPDRPVGSPLTAAEERLKADVTFLAADARDGRAPGTKGIEAAADYIADVFKGAGLKPAPGAKGYFQPFSISGHPTLGVDQELVFSGPEGKKVQGKLKTDFGPLALGIGATLDHVPIVFAGYGITAKDDDLKLDYDDYEGIDVSGKAVLLIRREPQQGDEASRFDGTKTTSYATFQHKATNAFQHGAAAVLMVNDEAGLGGEKDQLLPFSAGGSEANSNIPFVMLTRDFADKLLIAAGAPPLSRLERAIDLDLKPRSRELKGWALSGKIAHRAARDRDQERGRRSGRRRTARR